MLVIIILFSYGCTPHIAGQTIDAGQVVSPEDETASGRNDYSDSLIKVSEELINQSKKYLMTGKLDSAIRSLERAINLNPGYGPNYFHLAEAWLMKGNLGQAKEFNRLAKIYLKDKKEWSFKLQKQYERIVNWSL